MKSLTLVLLLAAMIGLAGGGPLQAAANLETKPKAQSSQSTPGVEAARTLSLITGVAISPLLGVGAVGAWHYFSQPVAQRNRVVWYAKPIFWVPALLLVTVVFLKDTVGVALPTALKKPLDLAEAVENKISGLVAAGAFVPLIVSIFPAQASELQGALSGAGFAAIDATRWLNFLFIPFALAAFVLVWLAAHAIQVLIIISPFTTVDAALKALRAFLLSLVTATAFVDPYVGAVFSGIIVVVAYFLAGWSLRVMVFGQVYLWDFLTLRRRRFLPSERANWVFTAREIEDTPIRSYGQLSRAEDGSLNFEYRPWLVLPKRTLRLSSNAHYAVGRGLLYSEIVRVENEDTLALFTLSPRYRGHEESLARILTTRGVQDVGLLAALSWVKTLFGFRPRPAGASA